MNRLIKLFVDITTRGTRRRIARLILPAYQSAYNECLILSAQLVGTPARQDIYALLDICESYKVTYGICSIYKRLSSEEIPYTICEHYLYKTNADGVGPGHWYYKAPFTSITSQEVLESLQARISLLESWL